MSTNLKQQSGYSLIELMIAMFLGGLLSAGAVQMFATSNENYRRLGDEVVLINNGQFVNNMLRREIQNAGHWGYFSDFEEVAYPLDVCSTELSVLRKAISHPVYGFNSPGASPIGCLPGNNFVAGTDILVIRRASTAPLLDGDQPETGDVYIQSNASDFEIQIGQAGNFIAPSLGAGNTVSEVGTTASGGNPAIRQRMNVPGADPLVMGLRVAAPIRKYRTDIYFIAPCTIPSNEGEVCTGAQDDGGAPVPTLKRLVLTSVGGGTGFAVETLAEGVENMQIQYGIDQSPPETLGSGAADIYVETPTNAQWPNVVNINVSLLIRSAEDGGFLDENTYDLGNGVNVGPFNDAFTRKVYSSNFRLVNVSMRREYPQDSLL